MRFKGCSCPTPRMCASVSWRRNWRNLRHRRAAHPEQAMAAWLDLLSAGGATLPLWLDDTDYSGRLLSGGRVPWLDPTALIAWRRRSVQLLKPSLNVLDVGRLAMAFAASRAAPG